MEAALPAPVLSNLRRPLNGPKPLVSTCSIYPLAISPLPSVIYCSARGRLFTLQTNLSNSAIPVTL